MTRHCRRAVHVNVITAPYTRIYDQAARLSFRRALLVRRGIGCGGSGRATVAVDDGRRDEPSWRSLTNPSRGTEPVRGAAVAGVARREARIPYAARRDLDASVRRVLPPQLWQPARLHRGCLPADRRGLYLGRRG